MALKNAVGACLVALPVMLLALEGCDTRREEPRVHDIEAVAGRTFEDASTLSFTIDGGAKTVALNSVYSSMAIETRLIDSAGQPLPPGQGVTIPAGETVRFDPEGAHVELIGVNRVARGLDEIELEFVFSDGTVLYAEAPFITPEGAMGV